MADRESKSESLNATLLDKASRDGNERRWLVVVADGIAATHPLPNSGAVVIGRAPECDVTIDDPSISRRHAAIHVGPSLLIEDLGSANGTLVRDQPLAQGVTAPIAVGEVVGLGETMVIVQRRAADRRVRRIWSHGYFETRLEDECARATRTRAQLAVLRIHCAAPASASALRSVFSEQLRPEDVVGCYGPEDFEVLLLDTPSADAEKSAEVVAAALAERSVPARTGLACFPSDGRDAHTLMAHACRAVRHTDDGATYAPDVVVADPAMKELYKLIERVAAGTISVLLMGETGSGKEVLAEAVHRLSPRADKELLKLNCAALSETLLESELFGHERGAFTGAAQSKPGLFEMANGGSVFLDEVGELPVSVQAKLLRVIEDRQVMRVGGLKSKPIDVRFIAATNRDVEAEVSSGSFREDLYFRLNGVSLVIPPLRDRPLEIEHLARLFARNVSAQLGQSDPPEIASEVLDCFGRYSWPGNIRELRNVIERAVLLATDGAITLEHLPMEKMGVVVAPPPRDVVAEPDPDADAASADAPTKRWQRKPDRQQVLDALSETAGNQTAAAKLLGVSRRTLTNWLDQLGIARPRKGSKEP